MTIDTTERKIIQMIKYKIPKLQNISDKLQVTNT